MDIEALKAKLTFYAADEEAHAQGGGASHALTEAVAAIESLQCELEEARRDVERYAWVVENAVIEFGHVRHDGLDPASTKQPLDNAVDAARRQKI